MISTELLPPVHEIQTFILINDMAITFIVKL